MVFPVKVVFYIKPKSCNKSICFFFFILQLIDDKKALSEKYDTVVKELKQMDKKYTSRIKTMEDT